MHPALENTFSPTPSRFAHLQTIEPLTTASGIIPGQALFDTPPTDNSPPLLERYHRTRKPTTRKIEASQSQPSTSKSKGKQPVKNATTASKPSSKSLRNAGNLSTSDSNADAGTQAAGTGEDIDQEDNHSNNNNNNGNGEDDEDDTYISQAIIEKLEGIVGHSVSHLSNRQLKTLLDAAWATQEITLESQAEQSPTIAKSHAGVGLAGGGHNGSPVHQDMHSLSQRLNTSGGDLLTSRKRPLDAIDIAANSKRVRISTGKDDSATEDESDSDLDPPRRRRRCRTNASDSDSDSDSDSEAEPPIAALPQPQRLPTGSQGGASLKPTHPKPIPTARPAASSSLPPSLVSAHPTTLTTSSNSPTALGNPLNATTYLVRYPPPTDLNDVDALAVWAIQRAQVLGYSPSNPKVHPPDHPSTTSTHVAQAIASHRSQLSGAERPGSQDASSRPSQSTSINLASAHEVTPSNDSTSATGASATLGHQKAKHKPKSKLGNFLGPSGEVASAAIPYFLATVFADGAYENLEVFRDWALDAYRETWKLEYPEFEYEVPPKGLLVIMTRRASWLRGEVKKRIRTIIQYGYGFRHPAVARADIKHNRRLVKKLGAHVFHCRDLTPEANHFEHPELVRAIGAGLFWEPESLGVVFKERFKVVPIPAIALILTMMQACIYEWRTGNFKADELDADRQQLDYERHLLSLYEYEKSAASRLTRFRTAWSKAGLEYSGTTNDEDPNVVKPYILASNIRPDTPPPERDD